MSWGVMDREGTKTAGWGADGLKEEIGLLRLKFPTLSVGKNGKDGARGIRG
jgi:hypothetical protein